MKHKHGLWVLAIFIFISFACNLPGGTAAATPTLEMATQVAQTVNAQMTQVSLTQTAQPSISANSLTPSATPAQTSVFTSTSAQLLTATFLPATCNAAAFVSETYPDGSQVVSGQSFVKSWHLQNVGTCTWTSSYQLIFVTGDAMGAPAAQSMSGVSVPPGSSVDVSVNLTAPASAGAYRGYFKLRAPDGTVFGIVSTTNGTFWADIQSVAPNATPASVITILPLKPISPVLLLKPDLKITQITYSPATPVSHSATHVSVSVYNAGSFATSATFTVSWWGLSTYSSPSCTWTISQSLPSHGGVVETCTFTYPSSYASSYSKATADTGNTISESDETNNSLLAAVKVQ